MADHSAMSPETIALLDQAGRDLQALALRYPRVTIYADIPSVMMLIGQVQLALRHPNNRGEEAQAARVMVGKLTESLRPTKAVRRLIELGNDPRHDYQIHVAGPATPVRPTVVAILGSEERNDDPRSVAVSEELCGRIVLRPYVRVSAATGEEDGPLRSRLDELVLRRIDLADEVLALCSAADVAPDVLVWVRYAEGKGKRVRYWLDEMHAESERFYGDKERER